jgi:hypothetical protein
MVDPSVKASRFASVRMVLVVKTPVNLVAEMAALSLMSTFMMAPFWISRLPTLSVATARA